MMRLPPGLAAAWPGGSLIHIIMNLKNNYGLQAYLMLFSTFLLWANRFHRAKIIFKSFSDFLGLKKNFRSK